MDVLVSMGSNAAYFYSVISAIIACSDPKYHGQGFFETSAMLISVVLLGRYFENMAKGRSDSRASCAYS